MQRNIFFWLDTRHPVSLDVAVLDNACLSVYIHGILILFLCLGWRMAGGDRNTAECFSSQETEVWRPSSELPALLLPERPQIICPLRHIQQPQSCGLPFLRATAPYRCGLCSRWPRSQAGELMKRSIGLLFWLIIRARVTAAPVIEPVMMIWFHQAARIKRTRWLKSGESVELCSALASSLWGFSQSLPGASQGFPHWTQRGCKGAKQGFPAEATMTLEHGVGAKRSTQAPQWNWIHFCDSVSTLALEHSVFWFFSQSCP